jgi:hypothetical protein
MFRDYYAARLIKQAMRNQALAVFVMPLAVNSQNKLSYSLLQAISD